jgi:hypothetical protein
MSATVAESIAGAVARYTELVREINACIGRPTMICSVRSGDRPVTSHGGGPTHRVSESVD